MDFGYILIVFYVFCTIISSMDFALIPNWFRTGFWYNLWWLLINFAFAHATCTIFKKHCFCNEFSCFYTLETHDFWWCSQVVLLPVLAMICDEFVHRCWHYFGIHLLSKSCFSAIIVLMICWIELLLIVEQKGTKFITFFHNLFDPVPKRVLGDVPWLTLVPFRFHFCCFWYVFGSIMGALRNDFPFFLTADLLMICR